MNANNTTQTNTDGMDDITILRNSSIAELRYIVIRNLIDNGLSRKTCGKVLNISQSAISKLLSRDKIQKQATKDIEE